MYHQEYKHFVRPHTPTQSLPAAGCISGDEAQRLYVEELQKKNVSETKAIIKSDVVNPVQTKETFTEIYASNKKLFLAVQNDDVEILREVLNLYMDKINVLDEYGWSLLMIACQADARQCVKELLERGIDVNTRDRAGNSARSLVIRNKNATLATLLLEYSENGSKNKEFQTPKIKPNVKCKEEYTCCICNNTFSDKREHLSSTIHNINASKGKKIPTNYVIPLSNKGYQILLKGGWDKEMGLGRCGTGRKCPIKAIPKFDKKGLGHEKPENITSDKNITNSQYIKKLYINNYMKNKRMEINFRREFY